MAHIEAKLHEFAMYPWCTPKRVLRAHLPNEGSDRPLLSAKILSQEQERLRLTRQQVQILDLLSRQRRVAIIRYALARWPALCRFLDDGRIELDTNPVERAIRPVALGRKNHLFSLSRFQ